MPDQIADMFSPMPAIAAAAAMTRHLRVGTIVLNNDFRHPALLAREAELTDVLSDGRRIVDQLRERRERWGLSYYVVMEPALPSGRRVIMHPGM